MEIKKVKYVFLKTELGKIVCTIDEDFSGNYITDIQDGCYQNEKGEIYWIKNNTFHREDGPAVEYENGTKMWYVDGLLHREDGPAVEYINEGKQWWINGKQHREDGPAVVWCNGTEKWYVNGVLHREDGPAVTYVKKKEDDSCRWYINGKKLSKSAFEHWFLENKIQKTNNKKKISM